MQKMMRTILVALLVATLTISPATACHFCGGYGGGGYYARGGSYGGGYYVGCNSGSPGYYESSYGGSCCGGEVVVSEGCGDCGACDGCGCEGCDGCSGCGEVAEPSSTEPEMAAPEPPVEHTQPSTVNRVPSEPAPSLPPQSMPSHEEADMHAMPSTEPAITPPTDTYAPPAVETPAVETPPAVEPTTPPAEATDDLFNTPATEPEALPVEEPATPSEADDFFSSPSTPATDSAPPTSAAEPTSQPTDDDLFAPAADEDKPAEEETPAEEEKPADDSYDLFNNTDSILQMPGGLASHSLRHWVDNTGSFTCVGRMVQMLDGKVQLLKANGRTTTVPLARLSQGDLEFVNRQASAQKAESLGKTAQAAAGWSN